MERANMNNPCIKSGEEGKVLAREQPGVENSVLVITWEPTEPA